mgnify:CR=1 FL=1
MASYAIQINEKTNAGQCLLQYLQSLGVVIERLKPVRKTGIDKALEDVKAGRVNTYESVDDMFEKLGINV